MANTTTTLAAGGLSGAIVVVLINELGRYGIAITGEEAAALGTIIASALHYATRWLPPENPTSPGPSA